MPTIPGLDDAGVIAFALLPGFLAYLVHHELTARGEKIDTTHALLWGLAGTLVVQAVWWLLKSAGSIIPTPDVVGLPLTAIGLGLIAARLTGTGAAYGWLREIGFTRSSSQATIWHSSFSDFRSARGEFAVFHLEDGKCYYGKICSFSRNAASTHVLIDCYTLLRNCDVEYAFGPECIDHDRQLLIRASEVKYVEFIPHISEAFEINGKPATSDATT